MSARTYRRLGLAGRILGRAVGVFSDRGANVLSQEMTLREAAVASGSSQDRLAFLAWAERQWRDLGLVAVVPACLVGWQVGGRLPVHGAVGVARLVILLAFFVPAFVILAAGGFQIVELRWRSRRVRRHPTERDVF